MPVKIIAEAGINHGGKLYLGMRMCDVAKEAGADCVKFQLFNPELMVKGNKEDLRPYCLQASDHIMLSKHCESIGIEYGLSVFDSSLVKFACDLGVKFIKVASGEITNHTLISKIAKTGKQMILSTGMSFMDDIFRAVQAFKTAGGTNYALLHCVSLYPTPPENCNVQAVETLAYNFKMTPIGFSDHSLYDAPSIMAVALGAVIVEKHFTLSRAAKGADHHMSLEPHELKHFCRAIRVAEVCRGNGDRNKYQLGEYEMKVKARGRWNS